MDKRLISDIILKCNDTSFEDFQRSIYEKSLLKASRKIARRYQLIQRIYEFESKIYVPDDEDEETYVDEKAKEDFTLGIPSFMAEYSVIINGRPYTKRDAAKENGYEYVLYRDHNQIWFNYSPRTANDEVMIKYTSNIEDDDYDVEELEPIIPSQYNDELTEAASVEVAKLGIAKFPNSAKGKKYEAILQLYYKDERNLNRSLLKNDNFVEINVWKPF